MDPATFNLARWPRSFHRRNHGQRRANPTVPGTSTSGTGHSTLDTIQAFETIPVPYLRCYVVDVSRSYGVSRLMEEDEGTGLCKR